MQSDTIFAVSTAPGRGAIAILRVSGRSARDAFAAFSLAGPPAPRLATLRRLRSPIGEAIDEALVLWFPAPKSATGEDMAEFHLHGGYAIVQAALAVLAGLPGFRPAQAGEFTRRAVENGRLDLTQAEALADLIAAETEAQRKQALAQYSGVLGALYEDWRQRLIRLSAHAEAGIDFADEELPDGLEAQLRAGIAVLESELARHLADERSGELVRDGLYLTVIGPPNAGKSSLVNVLAKRDIAIVSDRPGTTRDVVEARLDLGGYAVTIADTAGLRDSADDIEREGVRRALARAGEGDLVLLLLDSSSPDPLSGLPAEMIGRASLVVWNKSDLVPPSDPRIKSGGQLHRLRVRKLVSLSSPANGGGAAKPRRGEPSDFLSISVRTGQGMDALVEALVENVRAQLERPREFPLITRARHRHALQAAQAALQRARTIEEPELVAEELRLALGDIGRITGRVDIEDLLDVVFRDFCIGK